MTELYEALQGFTDFPIAMLALIFGIISGRRKNKGWAVVFYTLAAAAFLGIAVHVIDFPPTPQKIVWLFLYLPLFETVRRFASILCGIAKGETADSRFMLKTLAVTLAIGLTLLFIGYANHIFAFLVFGAICFVTLIANIIKYKKMPKNVIAFLCFLILPLMLQFLSDIIPYAVVAEHILLTAELVFAFIISGKYRCENL